MDPGHSEPGSLWSRGLALWTQNGDLEDPRPREPGTSWEVSN